jgi:acyl carrier protein
MSTPQTNEEILLQLRDAIAEALRVSPSNVRPDSRLHIDLGAESLDILDIRFRMEQLFGFKINQEEMIQSLGVGLSANEIKEVFTVGSLLRYVERRLSGLGSAS